MTSGDSLDFETFFTALPPPQPTARRPRSPRGQVPATDPLSDPGTSGPDDPIKYGAAAFIRPVPAQFLGHVFGIHPDTVTKRLANCPVKVWEKFKGQDQPRYDFATACSYLIKPQLTVGEWATAAKDFPGELQRAFWSGQRERQNFLKEAAELWSSEEIVVVLGQMFMTIRDTARQWVDQLPGHEGLTTEQYVALQSMVTQLIHDLHASLSGLDFGSHVLPVSEAVLADLESKDVS